MAAAVRGCQLRLEQRHDLLGASRAHGNSMVQYAQQTATLDNLRCIVWHIDQIKQAGLKIRPSGARVQVSLLLMQ